MIHANGNGNLKAQRVAVVGLGKQSDTEQERLENLRVAAAVAARKVRDLKLESYATIVHGAGIGGFPLDAAARATMESSVLALYRYELFKEATKSRHDVGHVTVVEQDAERVRQLEQQAEVARLTCEAVMKVRDLSVGPGNYVTPTFLADTAREIADKYGLEVTVWGKDELRTRGIRSGLTTSRIRKRLRMAWSTGTLPATPEMASIDTPGEASARSRASASSMPGSVSISRPI